MRKKSFKWFSLILVLAVSFAAACGTLNIASAPVTLPNVYMDPVENVYNPGESFTVNINVADVVDLYSWSVKVGYEEYLLEVISVDEGPFLYYQPEGSAFAYVVEDDYVDGACTTLGDWPGRSGSGTLMSITFNVTDAGKCVLNIFDSVLLDYYLEPIAHTVEDGYFETTVAANLVKKSAWPEHHHFDISVQLAKDGDSNQTLYGKVKNIGPAGYDLYVYVVFEIVRDNGIVDTPTSDVVVLAPGAEADLTADFGPLGDLDAGKHFASAKCWYSYTGTYWAQGEKIKTFSFAVVP